jgi:hypothetical protein
MPIDYPYGAGMGQGVKCDVDVASAGIFSFKGAADQTP